MYFLRSFRPWLPSLLTVCCLLIASPALAHRVNIFAFVDGNEIQVECGFNRSQKVKQGAIEVRDAAGDLLVTGRTDDQGVFRFPIPQQARSGSDLRIIVNAGEGHRNEWLLPAAEVAGSAAPPAGPHSTATPEPSASPGPQSSPPSSMDKEELERIVNAALDAKLSPIRQMLAEQSQRGVEMRDIIGGLGWIVGLAGIAAYCRRRPRV